MDTFDKTYTYRAGNEAIAGYEASFDRGAETLADSMLKGLSRGVSDLLADPIVQAVMAADGVDRAGLEALLRNAAAKLGTCERFAQRHC